MAHEVSHPVLEPLALNYLTFGFQTLANNLWAWITLLTATAITFWETSNTTAPSPPQQDLPPPDDCQLSPTPTPIFAADADSIGSTRGKFTAYFDLTEEEEEEEEEMDEDFAVEQTRAEEYSWETEMRLRMRMRMRMDLSWYKFQDLTVIDGSVVKMWEERR